MLSPLLKDIHVVSLWMSSRMGNCSTDLPTMEAVIIIMMKQTHGQVDSDILCFLMFGCNTF